MHMGLSAKVLACVAFIGLAHAYYVPGTYPREFKIGEVLSGASIPGRFLEFARWADRLTDPMRSCSQCQFSEELRH